MWDSNAPLQLLNTMPERLEEEHLEKLQHLLDADKYKNQLICGFDLCGAYAPFCLNCNKEGKYPCAVAYVNSKKAEGMSVEIAAVAGQSAFNDGVSNSGEETADKADGGETSENVYRNNQESETKRIRIAIARKKIL